jgi:hypothetical protein
MALMNTTPGTEDNPEAPAAAPSEHADRLDTLAALDPAEAPVEAEELAAELARDLEGVSPDGASPTGRSASGNDDEEST